MDGPGKRKGGGFDRAISRDLKRRVWGIQRGHSEYRTFGTSLMAELNPWDPQDGRRGPTPPSCPLTMHAVATPNVKKKNVIEENLKSFGINPKETLL